MSSSTTSRHRLQAGARHSRDRLATAVAKAGGGAGGGAEAASRRQKTRQLPEASRRLSPSSSGTPRHRRRCSLGQQARRGQQKQQQQRQQQMQQSICRGDIRGSSGRADRLHSRDQGAASVSVRHGEAGSRGWRQRLARQPTAHSSGARSSRLRPRRRGRAGMLRVAASSLLRAASSSAATPVQQVRPACPRQPNPALLLQLRRQQSPRPRRPSAWCAAQPWRRWPWGPATTGRCAASARCAYACATDATTARCARPSSRR